MNSRKVKSLLMLLRGGYLLALAAAVVPFGAVHSQFIAVACIMFAVLAMASVLQPLRPELQPAPLWAAGLIGLLVAWALLQNTSLPGINTAWIAANNELGPVGAALSLAPHAAFVGLASLILPGIAFVTGVMLFQDDKAILLLLRSCALLALIGALLGIYEFGIAPEKLLLQPRTHPMDGVTAFFVNRNTAATFLGLGAILWCALLLNRLKEVGPVGLKSMLFDNNTRHHRNVIQILTLTVCLLAVVVALFLTKSRAGISAAILGLVVTMFFHLRNRSSGKNITRRFAPIATSITVVLLVVVLYGGQYLSRVSGNDATKDLRWCFFSDMVAAIQTAPLTGTGYGSLQYVFPQYRNPACISLDLTLDRGHNGYLELAMGMGLPSLIVLLLGASYLTITLVSGAAARRRLRLAPAAALGTLALVTVHTGLDFSLQIPGIAVFTASILALGVAASCPAATRHRRDLNSKGKKLTSELLGV